MELSISPSLSRSLDKEQFLKVNFKTRTYIDFILDDAMHQTIFGSKRGGKSCALGGKVIYCDNFIATDKPGYILYCARTAGQAKRLILKRLIQVQKKYKFKWKSTRLAQNRITTEYNNEILFVGLKDLKSVYDLQGLPVKMCIIDEANLISDHILTTFLLDVVEMGMADFKGFGQIILAGNPQPIHAGKCWEMRQNPLYSHHKVNFLDNPHYSDKYKKKFIEELLNSRGETIETMSNTSKRLIYGIDVEDRDKLVLKFTDEDFFTDEDYGKTIPSKDDMICICGIDLGFNDATAIAFLYYDPIGDCVYIDSEYEETEMSFKDIATYMILNLTHYKTKGRNIV